MAPASATAGPASEANHAPLAPADGAEAKARLARLTADNKKRTLALFVSPAAADLQPDPKSQRIKLASKIIDEWAHAASLPKPITAQLQAAQPGPKLTLKPSPSTAPAAQSAAEPSSQVAATIDSITAAKKASSTSAPTSTAVALRSQLPSFENQQSSATALVRISQPRKVPQPKWHAPWKLMRVISGHTGWVRSITVDKSNEWFVTGAGDRIIKIWDLASGTLKLSLTGHISAVRGLADKQIKCWDLEYNKVIRHYHGHLSGIYTLAIHPTLDVLVSGGRDSTARVWDIRTKEQIFALTGHSNTVADVKCQESDPQIITGSSDSTIRLWDLAAGKTISTLTHHKKSVRCLAINPTEFTFASGSTDSIKQWKCPDGNFIQNLVGHNSIINTMSCNQDNVLFSGGDNGSMHFWDWKSGYNFQTVQSTVQPGSMENEAGIFCSTFDRSGARLLTGEGDKTIKVWKEDDAATPETHPIVNWKPTLLGR